MYYVRVIVYLFYCKPKMVHQLADCLHKEWNTFSCTLKILFFSLLLDLLSHIFPDAYLIFLLGY